MIDRREFIGLSAMGAAALLSGCGATLGAAAGVRLNVNPGGTPTKQPLAAGLQKLNLETQKDGLIYVPATYSANTPAPLILMLHGAGGNASNGMNPFISLADGRGAILLAPDSRDVTWDVIAGSGYRYDVAYINKAMQFVFDRFRIDRARISIEGFSDGASYAYGLGLSNGDVFSRIVAFSPGFIPPAAKQGKPKIFDSHGTNDNILNIDSASRAIVRELKGDGYAVEYQEFNGGHTVPSAIADAAMNWLFS